MEALAQHIQTTRSLVTPGGTVLPEDLACCLFTVRFTEALRGGGGRRQGWEWAWMVWGRRNAGVRPGRRWRRGLPGDAATTARLWLAAPLAHRLPLPPPSLPPARSSQRVIELGKLTPRVLDLFEATEHEALASRVAELGIRRWTPPLLPTSRNGPLGYSKPPWE